MEGRESSLVLLHSWHKEDRDWGWYVVGGRVVVGRLGIWDTEATFIVNFQILRQFPLQKLCAVSHPEPAGSAAVEILEHLASNNRQPWGA